MILDTCFLIDLQREMRAARVGPATEFLRTHAGASFCISVISVTEFLEGFEQPSEGERLLRAYTRIDVDSKCASMAARIRRELRQGGKLIGDFDILIAATALSESIPLVTRNSDEFSRIQGLELIAY
jgi:predicted nucleic acid-binding protein